MKNKLLNIIGIAAVFIALITAYFLTKEKVMNAGIKLGNMDLTINPGDNFYDYATLNWQKANPIPDDYSRYGSFDVLHNETLSRVKEIAEKDIGKIGTLYKVFMNTEKLNQEKTEPAQKYITEIDNLKDKNDLAEYLGKMHTFTSAFWADSVALDEKDSEHFLYNIVQGGLGLSRDYYFDEDEKSKEVRKEYKKFISKQMENFGIKVDAEKLYALEERMAKSFYSKEKLRDPHANYHKMSVQQIKEQFPDFDWDTYLKNRGAQNAEHINIGQPEAIAESIAIMNDTDFNLIKDYLKYRIVSMSDSLLDDESYKISFDFYNKTLAGQKEPKPRWKLAIGLIDDSIGEEVGHLYVEKYFPESAKKRMQELVHNLQKAYKIRIENLDWMSEETKKQALEKLSTFKAKIGYPDKWRNYENLIISDQDSLLENVMRIAKFQDQFWIEKIGKENDPDLWYMNAHEINAYYDPSTNEICFPAGILQYPFFDMAADDAFNYGAIGSIIGHEMTHGFDDTGRQFDKSGNLKDWWTEQDSKEFNKKTQIMKDYFNNINITKDIKANGEFTLGENLADYGGITISFTAYKNFGTPSETVSNLTANQRFFIAYANAWAQNIREEEAIRLTKIDEHSLPRWRVNGILPHITYWYETFNIQPTDKLYLAPEKRLSLW